MKISLGILFFTIIGCIALNAESFPLKDSPLEELQALISSTEERVTRQKKLRENLEIYLSLQKAYLQDIDNRELLLKTAKVANQALEIIKDERLSSLFNPSFLTEMTLFAKLAGKPCIPKIQ